MSDFDAALMGPVGMDYTQREGLPVVALTVGVENRWMLPLVCRVLMSMGLELHLDGSPIKIEEPEPGVLRAIIPVDVDHAPTPDQFRAMFGRTDHEASRARH